MVQSARTAWSRSKVVDELDLSLESCFGKRAKGTMINVRGRELRRMAEMSEWAFNDVSIVDLPKDGKSFVIVL